MTGNARAQTVPISAAAISSQQAPGLLVGVTFSPIDFAFGLGYLKNTGHVVFLAFVQGPGIAAGNDRGIWVGRPGALTLVEGESCGGIGDFVSSQGSQRDCDQCAGPESGC